MPGQPSKITLAQVFQDKNSTSITGTLATGVICNALGKCIDDASLGWSTAFATAAAALGVTNPLTLAGILGLATAMGIRRVLKNKEKTRTLQASLRQDAADQSTILNILNNLNDRTLTVGLDELALSDIKKIVQEAITGQSDRLRDELEAAFDQDLDAATQALASTSPPNTNSPAITQTGNMKKLRHFSKRFSKTKNQPPLSP